MSNNVEILNVAENVAKDKGLSKSFIIASIENALADAAKKKYGIQNDIKAEIDPNNGEIRLSQVFKVVDNPDDVYTELSVEEARMIETNADLGSIVAKSLPPMDRDRVCAQIVVQALREAIRDAEKEREYNDFKDRVSTILSGVVVRIENANVIVSLGGQVEAVIKKYQLLSTDNFRINDSAKAYVSSVQQNPRSYQIHLSRKDDMFLARLFEMEVPEIEDGVIEIISVARDPGSRAKISVFCKDVGIDAVGSCIGARGSRVRAVSNELHGEKIDIIQWEDNIEKYTINALAPATIDKVIVDKNSHKIEVIVDEAQMSLAIGKQGQNVKLASKLIGCHIVVITQEEASKNAVELFKQCTDVLINELNLDETIAQLLISEGYRDLEDIANCPPETLSDLTRIDLEVARTIVDNANVKYSKKLENIVAELEDLGVEQSMIDSIDLLPEDLLGLAKYGVKTVEDLSEITLEEFKDIVKHNTYSDTEITALINKAKDM